MLLICSKRWFGSLAASTRLQLSMVPADAVTGWICHWHQAIPWFRTLHRPLQTAEGWETQKWRGTASVESRFWDVFGVLIRILIVTFALAQDVTFSQDCGLTALKTWIHLRKINEVYKHSLVKFTAFWEGRSFHELPEAAIEPSVRDKKYDSDRNIVTPTGTVAGNGGVGCFCFANDFCLMLQNDKKSCGPKEVREVLKRLQKLIADWWWISSMEVKKVPSASEAERCSFGFGIQKLVRTAVPND